MNTDAFDADLARLRQRADTWANLPIRRRIDYLRQALRGTEQTAEAQVRAAVQAKGIDPNSALVGEEWFGGPVVQARTMRLMADTLDQVAAGTPVSLPSVTTRADGQVVAQVFPTSTIDKLTFGGFTAEIWQQPGITPQTLQANIAGLYKAEPPPGRVALVLGAGNVASIGPLDVVHKLFVEGQVVLLKFNPVNAYLGPFFEQAFAALISDGYVATAYGGADVGAYLCDHDEVDEIHVTGSDKTHDAIVFGGGEAGAARKAADTPLNTRRITSELGNVSPVVVVPGPWSDKDLRFHAENVATQLANNGGFNCNAAKVLVLHDTWPLKDRFLDTLRTVLIEAPQRQAYYPGAEDRYARFVDAHPQSEPIGLRRAGVLPWTLIPDVLATSEDEPCFTTEAFCGVLAQTELPGTDARAFLKNAVAFCNEQLWGTLNACIIAHPATVEALGASFEDAIAELEYGTVAINHWAALAYGLGSTAWGAFPGHTRQDIQSGVGHVHNAFLFDHPQKTVIRGPFRVFPKPPWFVTHRATHKVARAMMKMEAKPRFRRLPAVVLAALRG
jgi:acyl-CoA reductase-like NAD-dependent aldehyde dehydrogenase